MKRDFLTINDITNDEMAYLLKLSASLKRHKGRRTHELEGKSIGLLFQKPSNRTRVSFEVGIWQLGGNCVYLSPAEIDLGKRESVADVAKTLSRYLDGIVARTNTHQDLTELGTHATVPVINGLSDLFHPCQALADILSVKEVFGDRKVTVAYVGDGNNVCHSLMLGCARVGYDIKIATPVGYEPSPEVVKLAEKIAETTKTVITLTTSPEEGVSDSHVIYADVWVSMGQETETKKRLADFSGFQINSELLKRAKKDFVFMHCLPAHRELEVTAEIIDGPHSIIFDQAENRMHVQKAILIFLIDQYHRER